MGFAFAICIICPANDVACPDLCSNKTPRSGELPEGAKKLGVKKRHNMPTMSFPHPNLFLFQAYPFLANGTPNILLFKPTILDHCLLKSTCIRQPLKYILTLSPSSAAQALLVSCWGTCNGFPCLLLPPEQPEWPLVGMGEEGVGSQHSSANTSNGFLPAAPAYSFPSSLPLPPLAPHPPARVRVLWCFPLGSLHRLFPCLEHSPFPHPHPPSPTGLTSKLPTALPLDSLP